MYGSGFDGHGSEEFGDDFGAGCFYGEVAFVVGGGVFGAADVGAVELDACFFDVVFGE